MIKTSLMVVALALVTGASIACFGMFSRSNDANRPVAPSACDGLTGQAKIDCEKAKAPR